MRVLVALLISSYQPYQPDDEYSIPTDTRRDPITPQEWESFFDQSGRLSVGDTYLRKAIFSGGLDPTLRKEAWLYLTGLYSWKSTTTKRQREENENRYNVQKIGV